MWKPGQLVTIGGIVYKICRISRNTAYYPCDLCAFSGQLCCTLTYNQLKYEDCTKLIPNDCYFERLSPVVKWGFNSPSPRGQF